MDLGRAAVSLREDGVYVVHGNPLHVCKTREQGSRTILMGGDSAS